jgi:hypothetical protein
LIEAEDGNVLIAKGLGLGPEQVLIGVGAEDDRRWRVMWEIGDYIFQGADGKA